MTTVKYTLPKRNEKCWCESGKKYKKCCMARFEESEKEKLFEQNIERRKR